jgi:hypothetical protein
MDSVLVVVDEEEAVGEAVAIESLLEIGGVVNDFQRVEVGGEGDLVGGDGRRIDSIYVLLVWPLLRELCTSNMEFYVKGDTLNKKARPFVSFGKSNPALTE